MGVVSYRILVVPLRDARGAAVRRQNTGKKMFCVWSEHGNWNKCANNKVFQAISNPYMENLSSSSQSSFSTEILHEKLNRE